MRSIILRRKSRKKPESLADLARLGVKIDGLTPDGVTTQRYEADVLKDLYGDAVVLSARLSDTKKELSYQQSALLRSVPSIKIEPLREPFYSNDIYKISLDDGKGKMDWTSYSGEVGHIFRRNESGLLRVRVRIANTNLAFPLLDVHRKQDFENIEYKTFAAIAHLLGLTIQFNGAVYNEDDWRGFYHTRNIL